jgi:hypothetical protein
MAASAPAPLSPAVVRQGSKLIFAAPAPGQAVELPPVCVRCGAASSGKPLKKTFSWHNPAIYLVLLISPLIYVIVAVIVRKSMKVNVPLCVEHAKRRSIAVTLAWALPLIGFVDLFVLPQFKVDVGITVLIFTAFLLAGIVIWAVVGSPIRPKLINNARGEFSGFCEVFLQQFPEGSLQPAVLVQQFRPQPQGTPPPPPAIN